MEGILCGRMQSGDDKHDEMPVFWNGSTRRRGILYDKAWRRREER